MCINFVDSQNPIDFVNDIKNTKYERYKYDNQARGRNPYESLITIIE